MYVAPQVVHIKDFIIEQQILKIGIAFIISSQVNQLFSSFIDNILTPLILLLVGADKTQKLSDLYIEIYSVQITYGEFLLAVIRFIIMMIIMYYIILLLNQFTDFQVPKKFK